MADRCASLDLAACESSYKDLQRSFVTNLNGTTTLEISLVTSYAPVSVLLRSLLWYIVVKKCGNRQKLINNTQTSVLFFILEYLTLILPTLLVFTLLANYVFPLTMLLVTISAAVIGLSFLFSGTNLNVSSLPFPGYKKRFLYNFRAYVNIATAISILAVDFVIFPRRFAKTETYGTGLMDVGVGSFIISNAVVCHDARGVSTGASSFLLSAKKELRAVSLLLALGLARFVVVKSADYQVHVSEYGVHWNFFLTLAFVRVFSSIILRTLPRYLEDRPWIVGLLIGLFYHYALANGLEEFVLNGSSGEGSRSNFIDANREGICSCVGYLSLYFIGVGIGKLIFRRKYESVKCAAKLLFLLIFIDVLTWSVLFYWRRNVGIISRRLANFPFVLWQVSYNVQLLAMFLVVDILLVASGSPNMFVRYPGACSSCSTTTDSPSKIKVSPTDPSTSTGSTSTYSAEHKGTSRHIARTKTSEPVKAPGANAVSDDQECFCLITALNFNQLGYFLIANLLTGLVNISLETINASPSTAFLILNAYLLVLNGIILLLYRRKLLLKF